MSVRSHDPIADSDGHVRKLLSDGRLEDPMEHVSTVIDRTLTSLRPPSPFPIRELSRPRTTAERVVPRAQTLPELTERFTAEESADNPDVTLAVRDLRLSPEGTLAVPGLGDFTFTDWSRRQCASLLGLRWDKWFENAGPREQADELNRRFARGIGSVKVRTRRTIDNAEPGLVRAIVSPGYSPIADAEVAGLLAQALAPSDHAQRLIRCDVTDRTASYVVAVGEPYKMGGPGDVGDVWGGLLVRNSGVGYASLFISLHLTRLLCRNGMTAPMPDALLLKRRHRGLDMGKLKDILIERLGDLPGKLRQGAEILRQGRTRIISNIETELRSLLLSARLPMRLLPDLLSAYREEPEETAFGISQAATLAAQRLTPEERVALERATGHYLATAKS